MFGSSMLDIAVGVLFIFLLMSVLATALNEIILSFMNLRGKFLYRGIKALFNETDATRNLVTKIYEHGQVCGLYEGDSLPTGKHMPAYIPSKNFALALLGILEDGSAAQPANAAPAGLGNNSPLNNAAAATTSPAGTPAANASPVQVAAHGGPAQTAAQAAAAQAAAAAATTALVFHNIEKTIKAMVAAGPPFAKVGKTLGAMVVTADNDLKKLQKSIEDWYNSGMDRVSGWYKYHTQKWLFGVGLAMAIALNANTVKVVHQLSVDPTMRQAIVAAASNAKAPAGSNGAPEIDTAIRKANSAFADLDGLGLPIGWHGRLAWQGPSHGLLVLVGWLCTAVAVSLGAPFWFDLLNKIMVIRSTVKPAEKSGTEASKDKA
jgi:hypothetical protein